MNKKFEVLNNKNLIKKGSKVESFLKNTCDSFVDEVRQASIDLGEHPLKYREQSLKSYLLPAMNKITKRTLMEVYFNSGDIESGIMDKRNFADFYSLDEDMKNRYITEVKHSWHTFGQKKLRKDTIDKWNKVNEQIERLVENSDAVKEYVDKNGTIYCVSMIILVTYKVENPKAKTHLEYETLKEIILNEIGKTEVEWIYSWDVGTDLEDKKDEYNYEYPTVTLIGKVCKL